ELVLDPPVLEGVDAVDVEAPPDPVDEEDDNTVNEMSGHVHAPNNKNGAPIQAKLRKPIFTLRTSPSPLRRRLLETARTPSSRQFPSRNRRGPALPRTRRSRARSRHPRPPPRRRRARSPACWSSSPWSPSPPATRRSYSDSSCSRP